MILVAALVAFAVADLSLVGLVPLLRRVAMDTPNERSSHTVVTPRGGGLALFLGVVAGLLVAVVSGKHPLTALDVGVLAISLILGLVGFVDDLRHVPVSMRFGLQLACGLAMDILVFQGSHRSFLELCGFGVIGVVWLSAYVNAFNFMDGINGISGVSAIVAGLWYAWVGNRYGDDVAALWGLLLAAAALGFLIWNLPRAHVFMGDVGSYATGAIIAYLAWSIAIRYKQPVTALAPLAIYLVDTAYTLWRRYRAGSPLFVAHREHIYQRLVVGGMSHVLATGFVLFVTASICAAIRWMPTSPALLVSAAALVTYVASPTIMTRLRERRG